MLIFAFSCLDMVHMCTTYDVDILYVPEEFSNLMHHDPLLTITFLICNLTTIHQDEPTYLINA